MKRLRTTAFPLGEHETVPRLYLVAIMLRNDNCCMPPLNRLRFVTKSTGGGYLPTKSRRIRVGFRLPSAALVDYSFGFWQHLS